MNLLNIQKLYFCIFKVKINMFEIARQMWQKRSVLTVTKLYQYSGLDALDALLSCKNACINYVMHLYLLNSVIRK